jgi:predicted negative regulator of RcsB-dependent stress response
VVLALALIFGWRQWQAHRAGHHAEAAEQYAVLEAALATNDGAKVDSAVNALEKDFTDTPYAALGAAARANVAVGQGKLDDAHKALQWAVDHSPTAALHSIYQLRLARVELAQNQAQQALGLIEAVPGNDYRATREELRGDALLKLGRQNDARSAYASALAALSANAAPGLRDALQMKLDNLAQAGAPAAAPAATTTPPGKQGT